MKLQRTFQPNPALLAVVPLMNVVLLLLLFFLLGSSFVLQPGIPVALPFSRYQMAPQVDALIVTLAPGDPTRIYFRDRSLRLEEFTRALQEIPKQNRQSLIIRADQKVPYQSIVLTSTAGLEAGFEVILATTPNQKP